MAGYQKNTWVVYDQNVPKQDQPNAFITKRKLDNMEEGIKNAVTDLAIGTVTKGTNVSGEIITDENDPSIKIINLVLPKEVSWLFSNIELHDEDTAPIGASINDIIIDSKGNIFAIEENSNGVCILRFRMNIKGATGDQGIQGPQGNPGEKGEPGKEYYLEIGKITVTDSPESASAEIVDHKLNLVIPIVPGNPGEQGIPGDPGESTYDIWKSLGNNGDAATFIESLRGKDATVIDSLDSTSTTEALSANQGRALKNNRLTTLDEILANEEEGIFVDALAVKEMYLKLMEVLNVEFGK